MVLCSHVGSINFAAPANFKKVHKGLTSQVRAEAIHIGNKYKILIESIQFEWDKLLSTLEKDFLEILNEVLSHNNNPKQIPTSNEMAQRWQGLQEHLERGLKNT